MASIFGFFFIILIIILIFGLSIISSIFRIFFGLGKKTYKNSDKNYSDKQNSSQKTAYQQKKHKKIFDDDEGEYVDYEEIKDDK